MSKKRLHSIWVVLITTFVTVFLAGTGVAVFLYWKENFSKSKENHTEAKVKEDKIKGKNIVVVTSGEEKLFLNYINTESDKIIRKELNLDATLMGGKWTEANKNPLVQFSKDGQNFIFAEIKEPSLSSPEAYFKLVKADFTGKEQETLIDSKEEINLANFVYANENDNKVFYLRFKNKENGEISDRSLLFYDLKTKKEAILLQNAEDVFQKELDYKEGKIISLFKQDSKIFETSFSPWDKKIEKNFLFGYKKTKEFDLEVRDIFSSPSRQQFLYKDYTSKDGYSLKLYSLATKKVSTVFNDKNFSLDKIFWLSEDEIIMSKNPVVTDLSEGIVKNEIVKIKISSSNTEESLASSSNIITPLFFTLDESLYLDDGKIIYLKGDAKKEFQIEGLSQGADILFAGIFEY